MKKNIQMIKKNNHLKLVFLLFCVYFIYTMFSQQVQIDKYNSQIEMYNADIDGKYKLVNYYKEQKQNIESMEYIEQVARDTLGYIKPYEKIFVDTNR